jgi:hypothetical protein
MDFIDLKAAVRGAARGHQRAFKGADHGQYILGPEVGTRTPSARTGAAHCIAVASGRALLIALLALEVSRRRVIRSRSPSPRPQR